MLLFGDCLDLLPRLPAASVDLVLCDLPYGTTACAWDAVIPFDALWAQYRRIAKPNAAIVLTASQPFTTALIGSNLEDFRYCWVWDKKKGGNIFNLKRQPYKVHEDICVFSVKPHAYFPIMEPQKGRTGKTYGIGEALGGGDYGDLRTYDAKYPKSILEVSNAGQRGKVHPTQKPVALMEYLIRTYTNEGDTVLDNCMGSGTTCVAAVNTGRKFIGMERDPGYFAIAWDRVASATSKGTL